jgi:recombinational DNA repair ATPase RecF
MNAPAIYRLNIERFRAVKNLSWHLSKHVNVIGGGDVGKTTILVIEAILTLPPSSGINCENKHAWPWHWNGSEAVVRSTDDEAVEVPYDDVERTAREVDTISGGAAR